MKAIEAQNLTRDYNGIKAIDGISLRLIEAKSLLIWVPMALVKPPRSACSLVN